MTLHGINAGRDAATPRCPEDATGQDGAERGCGCAATSFPADLRPRRFSEASPIPVAGGLEAGPRRDGRETPQRAQAGLGGVGGGGERH